MTHLIFFDNSCPLCQKSVQKIQKMDEKKLFVFFPLTSEKAKKLLPPKLLKGDTLVLLENEKKIWIRSKAIFRILALLGKKGFGFLCYVPFLDLFYRLVAKNRHFILK